MSNSSPSSESASAHLPSNDGRFTETSYERILDLASARYQFLDYGESEPEPFLIWRHDIDYSPQRAMTMARLEAARGLRCVYHVLLSGRYYNVLEPEVGAILREIVTLGHSLGLHFDMDVFGTGSASHHQLVERISLEKTILETVLGEGGSLTIVPQLRPQSGSSGPHPRDLWSSQHLRPRHHP